MKERLIELMQDWGNENTDSFPFESVADYLLANGVIVPPCNVGDTVYRRMVYNGKLVSWKIVKMEVYEDEMGFADDSDNWIAFEDIGKKVFLTREEAEQALKGGAE